MHSWSRSDPSPSTANPLPGLLTLLRHAAAEPFGMHTLSQVDLMSGTRTRQRRPEGAATVLLQGRVSPETRAEVQAAAAESGVSIAYYLEALVSQLIRDKGGLPTVARPRPQDMELPIADVA